MSCWAAATFWNPPSYIAWLAPAAPIPIAACLRGCCPWGCINAWTPPILLIASCRSYVKRSVAERPGKGAAAGGGSGFELVPGGVGLLPQEHYQHSNNIWNSVSNQIERALPAQLTYLYLFATKNWLGISHLNSKSCLSMSTVSHKTKSFIPLDSDLLNNSSTKRMKVAMKLKLGNLQNRTQTNFQKL